MTGFSGCSARVASDQTVAVLASAMNSRRLMASPQPRTTSGMRRISHFGTENRELCRSKQFVAMSALGQKQTSAHVCVMSALPPKADIGTEPRNVRFVRRAQPVTATPLVVYRQEFRTPRSCEGVD